MTLFLTTSKFENVSIKPTDLKPTNQNIDEFFWFTKVIYTIWNKKWTILNLKWIFEWKLKVKDSNFLLGAFLYQSNDL